MDRDEVQTDLRIRNDAGWGNIQGKSIEGRRQ